MTQAISRSSAPAVRSSSNAARAASASWGERRWRQPSSRSSLSMPCCEHRGRRQASRNSVAQTQADEIRPRCRRRAMGRRKPAMPAGRTCSPSARAHVSADTWPDASAYAASIAWAIRASPPGPGPACGGREATGRTKLLKQGCASSGHTDVARWRAPTGAASRAACLPCSRASRRRPRTKRYPMIGTLRDRWVMRAPRLAPPPGFGAP